MHKSNNYSSENCEREASASEGYVGLLLIKDKKTIGYFHLFDATRCKRTLSTNLALTEPYTRDHERLEKLFITCRWKPFNHLNLLYGFYTCTRSQYSDFVWNTVICQIHSKFTKTEDFTPVNNTCLKRFYCVMHLKRR